MQPEPSTPSLLVAVHPSPPPLSVGPHQSHRGPPRRLPSPRCCGAPVRSAPTIARCFTVLWSRSPCLTSVVFICESRDEHLVDGEPWWRHRRPHQELASCALPCGGTTVAHALAAPCRFELCRPSALAGSAYSLLGREVGSMPPLWAELGRPASPSS
jgi:hypothetical protein